MATKRPPKPAPVTPLYPLFDINSIRPRTMRIECLPPYAPLWVDLWENPPSRLVEITATTLMSDFLVPLLRAWNLTDAAGQVLDRTRETIAELPLDVQSYIFAEYQRRMRAPKPQTAE